MNRKNLVKEWALIQKLYLNQIIGVSTSASERFCLIDKHGYRQAMPEAAFGIYDMLLGKCVSPLTDENWIGQLMDDYKVSVQWDSLNELWVASTNDPLSREKGITRGEAIVNLLLAVNS